MNVVAAAGFEPATSRLSIERSRHVELSGRNMNEWSRWRDSNARPLRPERSALTKLSYIEKELVGTARFELATSCVQGRCADQAALSPGRRSGVSRFGWGDVWGSNPRPPGSQTGALTD